MAKKTIKITKGQLFSVVLVFNENFLKALKRAPEILQEGVMKAAQYWHARMLPKHFTRGAGKKYGYGDRSRSYMKRKGNKPHMVFSGALERQSTSNAEFKPSRTGVATKMRARSLNFVPNTAHSSAMQVRLSDGRMYPNIKREMKIVIVDERVQLANIVEKFVRQKFKQAQS